MQTESSTCLGFLLGGEEYAIDLTVVHEILQPVEPTLIPRMPDYVKGIISLRGVVIPLVDMRRRLGLEAPSWDQKTRFVVVGLPQGLVAMVVSAVTDVFQIEIAEIDPQPCHLRGPESEFIQGVTRSHGRMVILLDFEKAFTITLNLAKNRMPKEGERG